jgi:hypothetical protein
VFGKALTRTAAGNPPLLASEPFDDAVVSPQEAISGTAEIALGIVPNLSDWQIISTYDRKPKTAWGKGKQGTRPPYERVYVCEYTLERSVRAQLGIEDACLDTFESSWYLHRELPA